MMEYMYNKLGSQGQTLQDAPEIRLPLRPTGLDLGRQNAFVDLGNSFTPKSPRKNAYGGPSKGTSQASSNQTTTGKSQIFKASKPSPKSSAGYPSSSRSTTDIRSNNASRTTSRQMQRTPTVVSDIASDSESSDEMDLLSSDYADDASSSQRPVSTASKFKLATSGPSRLKSNTTQSRSSMTLKEKEFGGVYVGFNGQEHKCDATILRKSSNLSGLKFKKNKPVETTGTGDTAPSSSSLEPLRAEEPIPKENMSSQQDDWSWPSYTGRGDKSIDRTTTSECEDKNSHETKHPSPLSGKSANSNRRITPPRSRRPTPTRTPPTIKSDASQIMRFGPPKRHPRPRPISRAAQNNTSETKFSEPNVRRSGVSQTETTSSLTNILDMIPIDNPSSQLKKKTPGRSRSRPPPESPELEVSSPIPIRKTRLEEFPVLSPTSSPAPPKPCDFPFVSPLGGSKAQPSKHTGSLLKPVATSRLPSAFPMPLSPPSKLLEESKVATRVKPPRQNERITGKGMAKRNHLSTGDDGDDDDTTDRENKKKERNKKKIKQPKAFPMSTQVLASIGTSSPVASSSSGLTSFGFGSSRTGKRTSEGGSGDERLLKKSKRGRDSDACSLLQSPSQLPFEDDSYSISIAPHVDPNTLCPYCDTPLPSNPSPLLLQILAAIKKKSQRDPRPSNPLGLKAPLTTFIAACQRHRFELQILPEAEKKGWPKTIKWKEVSGRVLKMKTFLQALIEDPGEDLVVEAGSDDWDVVVGKKSDIKKKKRNGPKASSIFWMEIVEEVKQKGLRAVSGVRGQFANFEKTQPGYYGELGSVIIHQTLYNMFPPTDLDSASISPLTASEFVQRVLVPEVALHLIMEDKDLEGDEGIQEALEILRDSSSYGVAMFPEDGGEWGANKKRNDEEKMGVGDLIVMERARKRRKELEEEEDRLRREAGNNKKGTSRRGEKQKALELSGNSSEVSEPPPAQRSRPRPRPILRDSSTMSLLTNQEPYQKSQIRSGRSTTRSRSRSVSENGRPPNSEEMERSPELGDCSRPQENTPPAFNTRAARGIVGPSIRYDSDASKRAVANGERRGRRGAPSRPTNVHAGMRKGRSSEQMDTEDDTDDEVVIMENLDEKTPIQKQKRRIEMDVDDNDNTPRAAPAKNQALAPLLAARARKVGPTGVSQPFVAGLQSKKSSYIERKEPDYTETDVDDHSNIDGADSKARPKVKKKDNFDWLLDDSSQSSVGDRPRNKR